MSFTLFKNLFLNKRKMDASDGNTAPKFITLKQLACGNFGRIYKVKMENNELRALKKIWFADENGLGKSFEEVEIMIKLRGPAIVQFYNAWRDNEFIYILMELCRDNMRHLIDEKPGVFHRNEGAPISRTEFFISWHLLKDLVTAVNFLHTQNEKIIHRDLKPANVLVTDGHDGYFIKLCDFGLAKTHFHSSHTIDRGSKKYMAPEVKNSRQYNEKADVFSVCVIALQIFGFVFNEFKKLNDWKDWFDSKPHKIYSNSDLAENFNLLMETFFECINVKVEEYNKRLSCEDLLTKMNRFAIDNDTITRGDLGNNFYNNFLEYKIK